MNWDVLECFMLVVESPLYNKVSTSSSVILLMFGLLY